MKLLSRNLLAIILAGFASTSALAGRNAGGALLVHTDDSIAYTSDVESYEGMSGRDCFSSFECAAPDSLCEMQACNPTSGKAIGEAAVFWVLAAFHEDVCPQVRAVAFGVEWDAPGDLLEIAALGPCGDVTIELPYTGWPDWTGTGTALTYDSPRYSRLQEIYWFAAYVYGEVSLRVTGHPNQGAVFGDNSTPSGEDPVPPSRRGIMGFGGAIGSNPEPKPTPTLNTSWGSIKQIFGQ